MVMLIPNLKAVLVPGISAAGFSLGEDFFHIQERLESLTGMSPMRALMRS